MLAANFLTAQIDQEAVAAAAARVPVVDFFWADPDPALVEIAHRGGALVSWQVGSLDEARAAAEAGCDVVVVQGTEAGGHIRGHRPLLPLRITLPKGHGQPPGAAATGHISAMPMYAGESAAAISAVESVAQIIQSWCAIAAHSPGLDEPGGPPLG